MSSKNNNNNNKKVQNTLPKDPRNSGPQTSASIPWSFFLNRLEDKSTAEPRSQLQVSVWQSSSIKIGPECGDKGWAINLSLLLRSAFQLDIFSTGI